MEVIGNKVNLRSVGSAKLARARTGALPIPNDGVKTAATVTQETAATIAANANWRPLTMVVIFFTARSAYEDATGRLRTFKQLVNVKLFIFLYLLLPNGL
jgi:hypothetical protein